MTKNLLSSVPADLTPVITFCAVVIN